MSGVHEIKTINSKLKVGIVLNTAFTIFEFTIGIFSGSLALISDAGHNLTDSLTLLISFFGNKISQREANEEHTYGYGRATILTALLNSAILIILACFIFFEGYQRILHPEPVKGGIVAIVAFIGIIVNGCIALVFRGNKDDLNMRSAYINMAFDALASVGALLAGLVIVFTNQTIADPLISIVIGVMLLFSAKNVVRDAMHVLLEGVPEGIDINHVKEVIKGTNSAIKDVDDLHIWAISSHYAAMSCHIVIENCSLEKSMELVKEIKEKLKQICHITHATIETELTECPPDK